MVQGSEILIILLVALVVLGPQRLPDIARKLGNWSVELRRAARDFRMGLEAEVSDFKEVGRDMRRPFDEAGDDIRATGRAVDGESSDLRRLGWVGPEPENGPTSSDALDDLDEIEDRSPAPRDHDDPPAATSDPDDRQVP